MPTNNLSLFNQSGKVVRFYCPPGECLSPSWASQDFPPSLLHNHVGLGNDPWHLAIPDGQTAPSLDSLLKQHHLCALSACEIGSQKPRTPGETELRIQHDRCCPRFCREDMLPLSSSKVRLWRSTTMLLLKKKKFSFSPPLIFNTHSWVPVDGLSQGAWKM